MALTNRGWLRAAVNCWLDDMRGIVEIAEGRERLQFTLLCLREFERRRPDGRAVIVVPTLYALDVWSVVMADYGVTGDEVVRMAGDERATRLGCVNLVTISGVRQLVAFTDQRARTLLIVDECQRAQGPWAAGILSRPFGATLGLASNPIENRDLPATPATEHLGPVLLRRTRAERGRGSLDLINVRVNLPSGERARYARLTSRAAAFQRAQRPGLGARNAKRRMRLLNIRAALSASALVRLPVAAKIVDQHRGDRTVVLLDVARSAEALGELLRCRGHRVCLWQSHLAPVERRANLGRFHHGEADVLIVCRGTGGLTCLSPATVGVVVTPLRRSGIGADELRHALRGRRDRRAVLYTLFTNDDERSRLDRAARAFPKTRVFWRAGTP